MPRLFDSGGAQKHHLCPGWVRTDMGGPKGPLSPQESVTAMQRLIRDFWPNSIGQVL
jgi:hypothetical protein